MKLPIGHPMHHASDHGGGAASAALFVLLVLLPLLALAAYLACASRERRADGPARRVREAGRHEDGSQVQRGGSGWSSWRSASFAVGVGLLLLAMAPPLAAWAQRDLRGHMVQHLLLGMFAPIALVLGAPGTLLLRRLPTSGARRLVRVLDAWLVRLLTHPVTAALFDIGGMALLYLTPLYALSQQHAVVHVLLHLHFVISGTLFSWAVAGPDPAPHRPGMRMRLGVLFVAGAAHGMLAKIMFGYGYPRGVMAGPGEIEAAAQWMYYGGDLAELLLTAALVAAWFRRPRTLPQAIAIG